MVRGEYDGIATNADLLNFFNKLPNGDRQFIILPGMAHSLAFLGLNHELFAAHHAVIPGNAEARR